MEPVSHVLFTVIYSYSVQTTAVLVTVGTKIQIYGLIFVNREIHGGCSEMGNRYFNKVTTGYAHTGQCNPRYFAGV